uniref:Crinkler effector protein N-terminal domain-containing protein n=1 Tax=Globisporangium ultimum (strain ATCC 200006 / CBS 805.95 / DAOM BR144) TaxID=431595 RepID=K3X0Q8_GLOUD
MTKPLCVTVRWEEIAAVVEFDSNKLVGSLQTAVKELGDTITCGARRLQLYLARLNSSSGVEWLRKDETAVHELANGVVTNVIEEIIQGEPMNALETSQHYLPLDDNTTQPPQDRTHVLLVVPTETLDSRLWKKARMGTCWMDALRRLQVNSLPFNLHDFLFQELTVKIPISRELLGAIQAFGGHLDVSTDICNNFFVRKGTVPLATTVLVRLFIKPHLPTHGVTQKAHISTDDFLADAVHPNMCFYIEENYAFHGQEKAGGDLQVPVDELSSKLVWSYGDDVPYVLGYAAARTCLGFVKIYQDSSSTHGGHAATTEILERFELRVLGDRLPLLLALLNTSRLLIPIAKLMKPLSYLEFGETKREDGVVVSYFYDFVKKRYPRGTHYQRIQSLRDIYKAMQGHSIPNIVHMKGYQESILTTRYFLLQFKQVGTT